MNYLKELHLILPVLCARTPVLVQCFQNLIHLQRIRPVSSLLPLLFALGDLVGLEVCLKILLSIAVGADGLPEVASELQVVAIEPQEVAKTLA